MDVELDWHPTQRSNDLDAEAVKVTPLADALSPVGLRLDNTVMLTPVLAILTPQR